jgi:hypothetical protein
MLYLGDDEEPLGQARARELLTQQPKVVRYTRAWVDDSELCLEVECLLRDGTMLALKMAYCWDAAPFRGYNYFADVTEWLLNNDWARFHQFVQKRLLEVLNDHATHDHDR